MKNHRFQIILSLFISLLSTGSAACSEATGESLVEAQGEHEEISGEEPESTADRVTLTPQEMASVEITLAQAEERDLAPSFETPAEILAEPDRQATIGPRVAGRVVSVSVNIGDRVERGASLVVLESELVGRARADMIAARARENVARRALARQQNLLEGRVTSQRAVEEAEGALELARADVLAARTQLAAFGITGRGGARGSARVALRSPIAGIVVSRAVHIGQWVQGSDVAIEVVNLDELWARATVYERDMRFVSEGQPVQVEVRAFPGEVFEGTISRVGGALDERTRTVSVIVTLSNPDHRLRPGMFATARIQGAHAHEATRVLSIPWAAVQQVGNHPAVFVKVDEGVFELHRVHTGERTGDFVEVLNGISAGDVVVAQGSFLLKGQLLRSTLGEDE
jgi:cobalt-zinc-cadmium efflux system membrane fusion protein